MATIIIKNSTGSGVVPSSLVQGELAINTKDGRLFYGSGSGNIVKEFTGSGGGGSTNTGSLLTTASVSLNTITFTKGDGSTFPITVNTGSGGGGGSTFPYTGSAIISGSLTITGSLIVSNSIDSNTRLLYDSLGFSIIDWENKELFDSTGANSISWNTRRLFTPIGNRAFEYGYSDYASRSYVYHQQNVAAIEQESLSNTNLEYSGYTIEATVDATPAVGDLIYLNTDGIWYAVDQSTDTSTKLLGVNIDGTNVLLEGDITLSNITTPDHGLPLYIRQGNGRTLSSTIPTSGYVRVIGHCYYQNGTTSTQWIVKFRPSNDWYEI